MTLKELLNKLIEKGWCPMGKEYTGPHKPFISLDEDRVHGKQFYYNEWWDGGYRLQKVFTLRELVSIDSGLWQFVCENGMIKTGRVFISWTKNANCDDYGNLFWDKACPKDFYEYRLIESSLKDESELEDFLLSNIKVEGH